MNASCKLERETKLIITRGYAGSGKTTWAKAQTGHVRVNRDDLRWALFGKHTNLTVTQEGEVTKAQRAQVTALLKAGINVVVDDTNLNLKYARDFADIAAKAGVEFQCQDFLHDADYCIKQDQQRAQDGGRHVGEDVIRKMAARYPLKSWQPVTARVAPQPVFEKFRANPDLPFAILTDIDGTLANHEGVRNPYDFSKVLNDKPMYHVIGTVLAMQEATDLPVIALSGRDDSCREDTLRWLERYDISPIELHMRATGDKRRDDIVKHEIFTTKIAPNYNPAIVFDDRLQVCRMWHQIGLPLLRVGDPDSNF